MEQAEEEPPKRKFRLNLEAKNTIPSDSASLSAYLQSALSLSLPSTSLTKASKHPQRLLTHYQTVLIVVQSAALGERYKQELEGCDSHVVGLVAGKPAKVQQLAIALSSASKVVAIGSPAALKTIIDLGGVRLTDSTVLAVDGRTNSKGYNIFNQRTETEHLRALFTLVFASSPQAKSLILHRNAPISAE